MIYMIPKIITVGHIFGNSVILTVVQKTIRVGATGENKKRFLNKLTICHSEELHSNDVRISRKGIRFILQGVRSRRLPRFARNDIVLRTEGNGYRVFRNDETSVARLDNKKRPWERSFFVGA